jgi:hypothetical protein
MSNVGQGTDEMMLGRKQATRFAPKLLSVLYMSLRDWIMRLLGQLWLAPLSTTLANIAY